MTSRRLWPVFLVVPLGTLLGHQVVYGLLGAHVAGGAHTHDHGHLGPLTALGVPLALVGVVGLLGAGRATVRASLACLAGAQTLAFAAMEVAERAIAGGEPGELVGSALLWWGIAIQVAVALSLWLVGSMARRAAFSLLLVITLVAAVRTPPAAALTVPPQGNRPPRPLCHLGWLFQRGPPLILGP